MRIPNNEKTQIALFKKSRNLAEVEMVRKDRSNKNKIIKSVAIRGVCSGIMLGITNSKDLYFHLKNKAIEQPSAVIYRLVKCSKIIKTGDNLSINKEKIVFENGHWWDIK